MKRNRGQINIVLQISTSDKDNSIVLEEHRRLLKILLTHELLSTNAEQFQWKDDFSKEALLILTQHAIQGRMNRFQTAMIRWLVYCEIHNILPLDYRVFTPILDKIRCHVLEKSMQGKPPFSRIFRNFKEFTLLNVQTIINVIYYYYRACGHKPSAFQNIRGKVYTSMCDLCEKT